MSANFVNVDRDTPMLLACDLRDWVKDNDLAGFVLEAVDATDLRGARVNHRGTGSAEYPPSMMLALLIYCYATGVFSSRRIERATYDSVSVRYICGNHHPDHDTIAKFRRRNKALLEAVFVQVLELAGHMGLLKLGTICIDGTKISGNADPTKNLTIAQIDEELQRLGGAVSDLLSQAEAQDKEDEDAGGTLLPEELASRQRINPNDPDSHAMPVRKGGFVQGYNAQAVMDTEGANLIVGAHVTNQPSDRSLLEANVKSVSSEHLKQVRNVAADKGDYKRRSMIDMEQAHGLRMLVPPTHQDYKEKQRYASDHPREIEKRYKDKLMRRLKTPQGRAIYQKRNTVVEGGFANIKHAIGLNQFRMKGLEGVGIEWLLGSIAYNCRKITSMA